MASHSTITRHSATELAALVAGREISAREVLEAHLGVIAALNDGINAFCTLAPERALADADRVDARIARGGPAGLIAGLPVALKDLTPTRGIRTTRGSRLFEHHIPAEDAEIVRRIRAQGGIVIGKTNTPEFGHKGVTDNLIFGATRNPWHPERVAGGSSGGSAAAVAAGMAPLAEGSDGAGSIRIPAALCGVYGFKPSYGLVPDVASPFGSHSPFFHNGPIARSVDDAVLLLRVLSGLYRDDPFSIETPEAGFRDLAADGVVSGLRVAYSPDMGYFPVAGEVARLCRKAVARLEDEGCIVEEVSMGLDEEVEADFMTLWRFKLLGLYGALPAQDLQRLEPHVLQLIEEGRGLSVDDLARANRGRERVWQALQAALSGRDLLLCPCTSLPAFPVADDLPSAVEGVPINPLLGWFLTYPINLTGNPAASIPAGLTSDGLPVGLQIIGRRLEDRLVLRVSRAMEQIAPWQRFAA